jgi:hypothetical protein
MSKAGLFDRGAIAASVGMRITAARSAGAGAAIIRRRPRRPAAGTGAGAAAAVTTVPDIATGIGPGTSRIGTLGW